MKVGLIGMGVVGRAQARMFGPAVHVVYDPRLDPRPYPHRALAECDFAVIAVGTPPRKDGSCDTSYVQAAYDMLPLQLPVMIQSTVPPGTTDSLSGVSNNLTVFVPEFLHEREGGQYRESADVPFLILGGTEAAREYFRPFLAKVHPAPVHECPAIIAEMIKYTDNVYWASRVTFINEMGRICDAAGIDFEQVRAGWLADPRMSPAYTSYRGFPPGFGGPCWPKDLSALIRFASDAGYEPEFLHAVAEANARFTGG